MNFFLAAAEAQEGRVTVAKAAKVPCCKNLRRFNCIFLIFCDNQSTQILYESSICARDQTGFIEQLF